MEIPNYDEKNSSSNGYKLLYQFMAKDTFRLLICGNSGSGKMNLLCHILQAPLVYYDQIHLYAKNLDQDKYISLIHEMNGISKEVGYDVLKVSNDQILPVAELPNSKSQKIVIFDNFVTEKNQKPIIDYVIQGHHKNCSVIYLTQSYYSCPKSIRISCSHFCLYNFPSNRERNLISQELWIDKNQYVKATSKPFSFCYVDKPSKTVEPNFYGTIIFIV